MVRTLRIASCAGSSASASSPARCGSCGGAGRDGESRGGRRSAPRSKMKGALPIPGGMRLPLRTLVGLLIAAAAALCPVPAQAAQKGVATDISWGVDQATKDRESAAIADLGAGWASVDVSWRSTETAKGVFDSAFLEDIDRAIA